MDRMENARAVFFLEEDSSNDRTRPLMLQRVLFCPILSWLRQQLRAEGIGRFFVWLPETMDAWTAEAEACFAPEDDVTVSCDRAALRDVYALPNAFSSFSEPVARRLGYFA